MQQWTTQAMKQLPRRSLDSPLPAFGVHQPHRLLSGAFVIMALGCGREWLAPGFCAERLHTLAKCS